MSGLKKYFIPATFMSLTGLCSAALQAQTQAATEELQQYYGLLNEYCVVCHNFIDQTPAGRPLYLDELYLEDLQADLESWEQVVRRLSTGQMPPQGQPHPGTAELEEFRVWLVNQLDVLGEQRNDPGQFVLHRLNRAEYANAIRDIFGLEVDISQYLPPDSSDAGFDNVTTALMVTPALMDRYLSTALQLSSMIIGDPDAETAESTFTLPLDLNQNMRMEGLPIGTRGGMSVRYYFPADGEYELSAALIRTIDNADRGLEGQNKPHTFEILVDGERVHSTQVGGPDDHNSSLADMAGTRDAARDRMKVQLFMTAGPHDIGFTFVDRPDHYQDIYRPSRRSTQDLHVSSGFPALTSATILGPLSSEGVRENILRDRLYVCSPEQSLNQDACAREILSRVARLAYRGRVSEREVDVLMNFFANGSELGGFDAGVRTALARILTSSSFLFRAEYDPEDMAPGTTHPVSNLELASRLSFFLWSSVPDDELLSLAEQNRLREPDILQQQVRRMLADDRANALTTNFPDQWLALRNLDTISPDLIEFPEWGQNLRLAAQEETRMLFDSLVRENHSVLELLSADYTFMNQRLAEHYGVPGIYGEPFQRVELDDPNRYGLLGQASILALTSVATRTSPVLRGKWVLSNLIGTPPLPPPADVNTDLQEDPGATPTSLRERLESHRSDPVCNSCHRNLDPIGFALENFDAVGQWRSLNAAGTILDASSVLADGTAVDSPYSLSQALLSRPDVFVGLVTEKLMTYALGRGITAYDMPMVRDVVRAAANDDYRFFSLIQAIIESPAFQMRQKPGISDNMTAQADTQ